MCTRGGRVSAKKGERGRGSATGNSGCRYRASGVNGNMNAASALTALSSLRRQADRKWQICACAVSVFFVVWRVLLAVSKWRSGALPPPTGLKCGSEKDITTTRKERKIFEKNKQKRNDLNRYKLKNHNFFSYVAKLRDTHYMLCSFCRLMRMY